MRSIAALLIFLYSACHQPNPFPYTATAINFNGEKPYMVNLNTGEDRRKIPDGATIVITGKIDKQLHAWPVIHQNDTGFIYPKFVKL